MVTSTRIFHGVRRYRYLVELPGESYGVDTPVSGRLDLPSVREIRLALEEVPGAVRDEPLPEDIGEGSDPATEIRIWDPDDAPTALDMSEVPPDGESDGGVVDEPMVIFEVPPSVTDADIARVLGEERIGELERLQQIRGIDALGWYVTFHQRRYQHGVHIPVEGVLWLVLHGLHKVELSLERKLELAFHAILRHELFHFAADCMMANWELTTGVEVYWTSRAHRNNNGYIELEEALANAYMLRGFKHPTRLLANSAGTYATLKSFCERQPAGYDDGLRFAKTRSDYLRECGYLSDMYSGAAWHVPDALDTLIFYPDPIRIDWTRCPIIVHDRHDLRRQLGIGISFFDKVVELVETPAFRRALEKLDQRLQKQWTTRKVDLGRSTALKSLDFKQWKKGGDGCYSVRVDGNYRAHLRYDRETSVWLAEQIGNHKAMGHG